MGMVGHTGLKPISVGCDFNIFVTRQSVRSIKDKMDVCEKENLALRIRFFPFPLLWAGNSTKMSWKFVQMLKGPEGAKKETS